MGAHRVSLKQLLKIGTEVLSTTAQTLSGAINEVRANAANAYAVASTAYDKATDADSLADDAYVRAGLLEPPVGMAGAHIVGHTTSEILTKFGTNTADAYGLRITYNGGCQCWAFGNGTNTSTVTKTLFEVTLQSGQYYRASFKDPSHSLSDLTFNIRNMNAAGSPIIASFTSASPSGTFRGPANSNGVVRARVEVVFAARFSHSGPPITFLPIITTPGDYYNNPTWLLSDYYNSAGDSEPASLPTLREAVGKLKAQVAALADPTTYAASGTPFTLLGVVTTHDWGADPILHVRFFAQDPALHAMLRKSSLQVTAVIIPWYASGTNNSSQLATAFVNTYSYSASEHVLNVECEVGDSPYKNVPDGGAAFIQVQW